VAGDEGDASRRVDDTREGLEVLGTTDLELVGADGDTVEEEDIQQEGRRGGREGGREGGTYLVERWPGMRETPVGGSMIPGRGLKSLERRT